MNQIEMQGLGITKFRSCGETWVHLSHTNCMAQLCNTYTAIHTVNQLCQRCMPDSPKKD